MNRQPLPAGAPFGHFLVTFFAMLRRSVVNPPVHVACCCLFSTDNSLRFSPFTSSCLGYGHGCPLGPWADLTDSNWAPVLAVLRFCGGGKAWLQQTDFGSVLRRQGDQLCERRGWSCCTAYSRGILSRNVYSVVQPSAFRVVSRVYLIASAQREARFGTVLKVDSHLHVAMFLLPP